MEDPKVEAWEKAYLDQSHDAALGRLYRGIVHNLNGEIQAMSMNAELLGLMIEKAREDLQSLSQEDLHSDDAARKLRKLHDLIASRSGIIDKIRLIIRNIQKMMRRTTTLENFRESLFLPEYSINNVVLSEKDFLCADPFFKHKVKKDMNHAEGLPTLRNFLVEIHQIIAILLQNALEAMRETSEPPMLLVQTGQSEGFQSIVVQDSGSGIDPAHMDRIFEPFFTTKTNHAGLGLHLARKIAALFDAEIACQSNPGCTRFTLTIPTEKVV